LPHDDIRMTGRILVVEPDDDTRALYSELLHFVGFEVVEAFDGRDAFLKASTQRPVLVITEMRLPICDGYALCELLRRDSTTQNVPILAVTTETRRDDLERAHTAGADAVLVKPAVPQSVLAEIRRLLRAGVALSGVETPRHVG
jgi:DNA-binding response OmpR family regulator